MDYKFKNNITVEKKTIKRLFKQLVFHIILTIYKSKLFEKLKWNTNLDINYHLRHQSQLRQETIIDLSNIIGISKIAFVDTIEIESARAFKKNLRKILPRIHTNKRPTYKDPYEEVAKAFKGINGQYKVISYGKIVYLTSKENKKLDLIDGIEIAYTKGEQSHLMITYIVNPSQNFKDLLSQALKKREKSRTEITFNSPFKILKKKKIVARLGVSYHGQSYWIEKLLDELAFQLKTVALKGLNLGLFLNDKKSLFPRIITYEYDRSALNDKLAEEIRQVTGGSYFDIFIKDEIFFIGNFNKTPNLSIDMFFPKEEKDKIIHDYINSYAFMASEYSQGMATLCALIGVSQYNRRIIINLRQETFIFIKRNKVSLFLKSALKLKNKLSISSHNFERIRKDFTHKLFGNLLYNQGIPDLLNTQSNTIEFKKRLIELTDHYSTDVKKSFEELQELYTNISEDNITRANMRLQKLLFWIAILGIILALYGSNSTWVNGWINTYLHKQGIYIPQPPTN